MDKVGTSVGSALGPAIRDLASGLSSLGKANAFTQLSDITSPVQRVVTEHGRIFADLAARTADQVRSLVDVLDRSLRELPERYRAALTAFGEHGWYLDPYFPVADTFAVGEAYEQGAVDRADTYLCDWTEGQLSRIVESASKRFSHRATIITAAGDAHRQGAYVLSIPVLLSQADGICIEVTHLQLFSRRASAALRQHFEGLVLTALARALLEPLLWELPMSASTRADDPDNSECFSRHAVLHGISVSYGTRPNSCRALSLLSYVTWVLGELHEDARSADGLRSESYRNE